MKESSNPKTQVPKTGTWATRTPLNDTSAESAAVILFVRFRCQAKRRSLTAGHPSVRGLNEAPAQGGQNFPTTTGANYHFSTVQYVKNPTTKSVIPDKPECKPGACGILKP